MIDKEIEDFQELVKKYTYQGVSEQDMFEFDLLTELAKVNLKALGYTSRLLRKKVGESENNNIRNWWGKKHMSIWEKIPTLEQTILQAEEILGE